MPVIDGYNGKGLILWSFAWNLPNTMCFLGLRTGVGRRRGRTGSGKAWESRTQLRE